MRYSVIVPVYNRPKEVDELLESLCAQTFNDFEVIVVEDGSTETSETVCARYRDRLDLHYFFKPNTGPGPSRNYGAERSHGEYLIILDSDVIVPSDYLQHVEEALLADPTDAFGGPDRAHPSFSPIQKAISYAMTSFFTTGGIRGGKAKMDKFYPRSFNMGVRKSMFQQVGGFAPIRYGEDIDLSTRLFEAGCHCPLFPEAYVYHKRRVTFSSFFRQVKHSGEARVMLKRKYPGTFKLVHLLPAAFTVGCLLLALACLVHLILAVVLGWACPCWALLWLAPIVLYALMVFGDALIRNQNLRVALLSVPAAFTQLFGYGLGFIQKSFSHAA